MSFIRRTFRRKDFSFRMLLHFCTVLCSLLFITVTKALPIICRNDKNTRMLKGSMWIGDLGRCDFANILTTLIAYDKDLNLLENLM